ncbi:MAG: MBL fold metallo-hydrolase [Firmicutes bacterium]|nr:MBL fold metallo-hydrolase [Bacillota bacterium]
MEQLAEGIARSRVPSVTLPPYAATECYWVGSPSEVILVDAGDGSEAGVQQLEDDWETLGSPAVRAVFATHHHGDHTGGGAWAHRRWGCPLYLAEADIARLGARTRTDAPWQPFAMDSVTIGGIRVDLVAAPGHTPGQCNFWIPSVRGLLAGDNVLGNTTVVIVPPDGHLGEYMETLIRLKRLGAEWIGPGHGDVVQNPDQYLGEYLAHRHERSRQILDLLHGEAMTPRTIAEVLYRDKLPLEQMAVGEWMVRGHLEWFQAQGWVQEERGRYRITADGRHAMWKGRDDLK